jgi:hypothetical protein
VTRAGGFRFPILLTLVSGLLVACSVATRGLVTQGVVSPTATQGLSKGASATPTATPLAPMSTPSASHATVTPSPAIAASPQPTAKMTPTLAPLPTTSPTAAAPTPTPAATANCGLGTGLRRDTASIVVQYGDHLGLVMSATVGLAEIHFAEIEGAIRVLGAPSLEALARKADQAQRRGVPYEALAYGLERNKSTPEQEWQDLVGSTEKARAVADKYGKLLLMGPGFRLMSENEDKYPAMAALADIWVLQTQRLQTMPAGPAYRKEVEQVVEQIRAGNPDIMIWAQITMLPDREPSAEEWLAYHRSIEDLVGGRTYVGAYAWEAGERDPVVAALEAIFAAVCDGKS